MRRILKDIINGIDEFEVIAEASDNLVSSENVANVSTETVETVEVAAESVETDVETAVETAYFMRCIALCTCLAPQ